MWSRHLAPYRLDSTHRSFPIWATYVYCYILIWSNSIHSTPPPPPETSRINLLLYIARVPHVLIGQCLFVPFIIGWYVCGGQADLCALWEQYILGCPEMNNTWLIQIIVLQFLLCTTTSSSSTTTITTSSTTNIIPDTFVKISIW